MPRRFICVLLTTAAVYCALSENNEFTTKSEDKLLTNAMRAKSSSKMPHLRNDSAEEQVKSSDKQPRTVINRLESESRGSSCCGSKYDSTRTTRPDWYNGRIPVNSGRYPNKYGDRVPADRYGWQTQPPDSGRPGSGSWSVGTSFYEGSQTGDRFGSRPNFGTEGSRKPSVSGGYGHGGYGYYRPTDHGGISGTFANGDEFGPLEPNYPEGNAPTHPNIQTQKAAALKALAGVALIGAAAALATNPVLFPLGVVSGRKKRSNSSVKDEDAYRDYMLNFTINCIKATGIKTQDKETNRACYSALCITKMICDFQKNHWLNYEKGIDVLEKIPLIERFFVKKMSNGNNEELVKKVEKLLKSASNTVTR